MSATAWAEGSTRQPACLICGVAVPLHGICNSCCETGRRLDECSDCDVTPPCICEIALGHEQMLGEVGARR